ncbi:hypothetical protein, partial [Rubritalea profundi]|uniref:hypothetical protein n=1 Tax=Rubritalea profundi TaxID=1658618 RepID=UPI00197D8D2F
RTGHHANLPSNKQQQIHDPAAQRLCSTSRWTQRATARESPFTFCAATAAWDIGLPIDSGVIVIGVIGLLISFGCFIFSRVLFVSWRRNKACEENKKL